MYRHLLIATDGSKIATKAVECGLALARQLIAKVTFVTVTELWSAFELATASESTVNNPLNRYEELCRTHASQILDDATERAHKANINFRTIHVRDSSPAEAVIEAAKTHNCDLIIVGSHGRRGFDLLLLGSQAAKIVALSQVPVLVYKSA